MTYYCHKLTLTSFGRQHVSLAEISKALMWGAQTEGKGVSKANLRAWFKRFNGNTEMWDVEIGDS